MDITDSIPLTLGQTIGSLMAAVIEAQAQAARATVEFIEDVGTLEGSNELGTVHDLRNVSFKYRKLDENFEAKEFVIEIPLLSMVDIPLITVKSAVFSFNYQISRTTPGEGAAPAASSGASSAPVLGSAPKPLAIAKPALITGTFKKPVPTSSQSSSSVRETGGLDVTIELEKAPLPVGIDRILDILELAATETKSAEEPEE